MKKWIAIIAVVLVVGGAGGFFFMTKEKTEEGHQSDAAAAEPEKDPGDGHGGGGGKEESAKGSGTIYDLDPFVVNLADHPEIRYLKVTIKLDLSSPKLTGEIESSMPQIRDSMLILLSSKDFASVRTVEGKMTLREEILQRINHILKGGRVTNAYFTEFVAQ